MNRRPFTSLFLGVLAAALTGCISLDMQGVMSPSLKEHEIERDGWFSRHKILIVDVSGVIRSGKGGGLFSRHTTPKSIRAILNKAADDKSVKAMVLRINSPGGEATATDIVYHDILAFK